MTTGVVFRNFDQMCKGHVFKHGAMYFGKKKTNIKMTISIYHDFLICISPIIYAFKLNEALNSS